MCHETCATCTDELYTSCSTCIPTRYLFQNTCQCPDNTFSNDEYTCYDQSQVVEIVWYGLYIIEIIVMVFALIAFFSKTNAPLSRKLIDLSQAIGLLLYIDTYLDNKTTAFFQLFNMANLSYFFPNYVAEKFYGADISIDTDNKYIDMSESEQNPSFKFLFYSKSSNFAINQVQTIIVWLIGFAIYFLVGVYESCIKKTTCFKGYFQRSFKNCIYVLFYFTFQESVLNVLLQLRNLQFYEVVHFVGLGLMVAYGLLCWVVIRSILMTLNKYPEVQPDRFNEVIRRQHDYHFIYLFDGPVRKYTEKNVVYDKQNVGSSTSSNWLVYQLLMKVALVTFVVLQYSHSAETSLLIVAIISVVLFVIVSPVHYKLLWVLMLVAEAYFILNVVLVPNYESDFTHLFWPGCVFMLLGILIEIFFANKIYKGTGESKAKVHPGIEVSDGNRLDVTQQKLNQTNTDQDMSIQLQHNPQIGQPQKKYTNPDERPIRPMIVKRKTPTTSVNQNEGIDDKTVGDDDDKTNPSHLQRRADLRRNSAMDIQYPPMSPNHRRNSVMSSNPNDDSQIHSLLPKQYQNNEFIRAQVEQQEQQKKQSLPPMPPQSRAQMLKEQRKQSPPNYRAHLEQSELKQTQTQSSPKAQAIPHSLSQQHNRKQSPLSNPPRNVAQRAATNYDEAKDDNLNDKYLIINAKNSPTTQKRTVSEVRRSPDMNQREINRNLNQNWQLNM